MACFFAELYSTKRFFPTTVGFRHGACVLAGVMIMAALFSGCANWHGDLSGGYRGTQLAPVVERIHPDQSVAVTWISDAETYDITALGNLWRDRIEKVFSDAHIRVKGRRDLTVVLEDIESFGLRDAEKAILEKAGADIVVTGNYRVIAGQEESAVIKLMVKALCIETAEVIGAAEWIEPLAPDWPQLAARRMGNVYQKKIDTITSPALAVSKPVLRARLDRSSACYAPGDTGTIHVETEPGVYLYLLNLTADGTVSLLYPNRLCPFGRLPESPFVFPPEDCREDFDLVFYPFREGEATRESVKVIASRRPFDFSFLPAPVNQVFLGAEGGDIRKVYNVLDKAKDWSDEHLTYTVGEVCQK